MTHELTPQLIRLQAYAENAEILIKYLSTQTRPKGASNEIRKLKSQLSRHYWDADKKELYFVGVSKNLRQKIVTSLTEVEDVLQLYHSSSLGEHSGVNSTLGKISTHYRWPGVREDVVSYVRSCNICQRHETLATQAPEQQPIKVTEPLELVGMDLIGPLPTTDDGNKYVLTITDFYSKFVDFFPLTSKAAAGVACRIQTFICRWGVPKRLLSNQGGEFVSEINNEMCRKFNITGSVTSAYHPQMNGLNQRTNQTLKTRLSKLMNEKQTDWDMYLEPVAYSIRTQKQQTTKFTPFYLMFGRHPRSPLEMKMDPLGDDTPPPSEPPVIMFEEMVSHRQTAMDDVNIKVLDNMEVAQTKKKAAYMKRSYRV